METLLGYIVTFVGGGGLILILIFLNPEKAEIWSSRFWRIITWFWKGAEKKYIAHDIQGRLNDYSKILESEVKNYKPVGIKIVWVEKVEMESSFFQDNALIIRIRKSEDQNKNFVVATMTFISRVMLRKATRYISSNQKESIDLYVAKKILEKERPEIVDRFLQDFLIAKTEINRTIAEYFDKYSIIDKVGLFFPIFIQELNFLGDKVFGGKKENLIINETNGLIDFLKLYSEREIGEERKYSTFNGRYCRFGVIIVAKSWKVAIGNIKPYLKYLEKILGIGMENIYLIGPTHENNINFMTSICKVAAEKLNVQCFFERRFPAYIKKRGKREKTESFLILLRSKNIKFHYDSEEQQA